MPNAFASVLADRLSGFIALVIIALGGCIPVALAFDKPALIAVPVVAGIALVLGIWILTNRDAAGKLMGLTRLERISSLSRFVNKCVDCFVIYRKQPCVVLKIMAISFCFQLSVVLCVSIMGSALLMQAQLFHYCAFVPLIELLVAVPISIYGLGVRDVAYVFFFGLVGVQKTVAGSLALLFLAINIAYALFGGILFMLKRGRQDDKLGAMKKRRIVLTASLVTLVAWAVFSWPLPRYVRSGIPSSSRNIELHHQRSMIPGDHLQLLYHFWLASDMTVGGTPWMQNLYEFNFGDDEDRDEPDAYYFPFSFIYSAAALPGGRAFAWNFTGLISLLVTFLATWRLARRYTDRELTAAIAALVGIMLPYRWITLLGGSPTGFAMCLVPLIALGVDTLVRDGRAAGGVLAGIAVLLSYCSDLHVFFFGVLFVPLWGLVALSARALGPGLTREHWNRMIKAAIPLLVLGAIAYWLSTIAAKGLTESEMSEGWPLREIARYSPWRRGLFTWKNMGVTNQIFVGLTLPLTLAAGGVTLLFTSFARPRGSRCSEPRDPVQSRTAALCIFILLGICLVFIISLALGTNGPMGGGFFKLARMLIPPYEMIRQPAKIYCLMPTLLAVAGALSLAALINVWPRRSHMMCVIFGALLLFECRAQVSPTICGLATEQGAYKAVIHDQPDSNPPRALALPLWPGNTHWSSLYQHYASLYRLRMVNGYKPAVPSSYIENVFRRFESMNQGHVTDAQLDALLERDIQHVLLHEDAFPEKVSPFPVGITLKRMLLHPRLVLIEQDERVWAFRILAQADESAVHETGWNLYFPARYWEAERVPAPGAKVISDARAGGGAYARLAASTNEARFNLRAPISDYPGLRYRLRVRGEGTLHVATGFRDSDVHDLSTISLAGSDWQWIDIPVQSSSSFFTPELSVSLSQGHADVDLCLLAAGDWHSPPADASLEIPAPCFFHAGYTDRERRAVILRKGTEPDRVVFYGPMLPLEPGAYAVEIRAEALDDAGTRFGELTARLGTISHGPEPMVAGGKNRLVFETSSNLPLRLEFRYARESDMMIEAVIIHRLVKPDA